jgi:predicted nucleic acid-binding protein
MSGFLLDTNVISELIKPRPEPNVTTWVDATDESLLYLSVLTLGEIRRGIATLPKAQARRRTRLDAWLETDLKTRFSGRLLPVDDGVAHRWGLLSALAKQTGVSLGAIDGLLAATAIDHDLTLVTRDVGGMPALGVNVFNPWEAS